MRRGRTNQLSPSGRGQGEGEKSQTFADRSNEILFIDARNLGHLINRRTKELSHEDIKQITDTYHAWRNLPRHSVLDTESSENKQALSETQPQTYQDIPGFCASVSLERVKELDYVLTPGRYVGLPDDEDDFNFSERFNALKSEFEAQLLEEEKLNRAIAENLARVEL
jgi:type I restriction enzyme M protein